MGLITLGIAILSTMSFLTTYSFLFGYYFGEEINNSFSNFEIFRRIVPFHLKTMTFTYLIIALSVGLIFYSYKLFQEQNLLYKLLAVFCIVIYHLMMTVFFAQEITLKNVLLFGAIWVIPLFICMVILYLMRGIKSPFKTYSGAFFWFTLIIIYFTLFQSNLSEEWMVIWLNVGLFFFGTLFSCFSFNKYWNFIFVFPYIFVPLATFFATIKMEFLKGQTSMLQLSIIIGISLLGSVFCSYFLRKRFTEKDKTNHVLREENTTNTFTLKILTILFNPKTNQGALAFIIIMLLFIYVMTPRVAVSTAKIIRSFTPESEFQYDLISIKDLDGQLKTFKGIIVAEQEGVIYISNKKWELEQVKTAGYYVEREKDQNSRP